MYVVSEDQKSKVIGKINNSLNIYKDFIHEVNKVLLSYGREYHDYTKGKITAEFIQGLSSVTTAGIVEGEKKAFADIITALEKLKTDYIKENYPEQSTEDQLELDFIGKELEVMSREELEAFYMDNFLDKNKMRLFDIEIKKRSRSTDGSLRDDAAYLSVRKEQFLLRDRAIMKINERVKFIDAMKQLCSNGLYLVKIDEAGDIQAKHEAMHIVIGAVNGRSTITRPEAIDIYDLLNWRE